MRFRIRRRSFGLQVTILSLTAIVALARYWYNVGFDQKYRQLIADELAGYGLGAEIGRLTLDPVEGLTARDVKLFDLATPGSRIAGINRITLDIDLARLVNREDFLRSITLTKAHLLLPVDPADETSEWIRVRDLNARLIVKGRQIEIAHAEANLSGIHVTVRGEVTRGAPEEKADPEAERRRREQHLREMRDRRGALRSVLRVLDRFSIPVDAAGQPRAPHMAQVELELHGNLADLDRARVRATMRGGPLRCGNFHAAEYSADAILEDGELTLRRLNVLDAGGSFSASASWKIRHSAAVDVAVDSSIDVLALMRGTMPELQLPEGLAITGSPRFRASGVLYTDRPFTLDKPPLNLTGSLTAGAFTVKSENYESLHGDFALREDGFLYLRNVKIAHGSGTVSGQFMRRAEDLRYEFALDAGMAALTPLLDMPEVRRRLAPVAWSAESHVSAAFSGTGTADGKSWRHRGTVDARDYRLRGAPVRQFEGRVEVGPGVPPVIAINDFLLRREDGDITGKSVVIDHPAQRLHLKGVTSTCMPSPAAGMFAPKTGEVLARYHFASPPRAELEGSIGMRSLQGTDLHVKLYSPAACGLPVGKENWRFTGVSGSLHLRKDVLTAQLTGKSIPRQVFSSVVRFDIPATLELTGDFGLAKENNVSATRYTVVAEAPEALRLLLADREIPIDELNATVRAESGRLTVNAGGRLYGGRVGSMLEFPNAAKAGHRGSVAIDGVGFSRLMALFGTEDDTGGTLSGRFTWQTPDGSGVTIDGSGTAALEDGNIFAVPLLGPLSTIISALLPGDRIAYSVARKATASFRVANGRVSTKDFEAATRTFRLSASGVVDVARNFVDLDARVNLRGAPGLLLYPVSKLFEYHAGGSISEPGWRPKHLPTPFLRGEGGR
jgi:AsmA-like C-terminal region